MPRLWIPFAGIGIVGLSVLGVVAIAGMSSFKPLPQRPADRPQPQQVGQVFGQVNPTELPLQVGVIQRFGRSPKDVIKVTAAPGDRLQIQHQQSGQLQTLVAPEIYLSIAPEAVPLGERVVLSGHRSFETAEEDAARWQALGVEVEVVQPQNWQVWGKRSVYTDGRSRQQLLDLARRQGGQTARLDNSLVQRQALLQVGAAEPAAPTSPEKPALALPAANPAAAPVAQLTITSGQGQFQVTTNVGEDRPYRSLYAGMLELKPNVYGSYTLVNQTPLETYLRGVVPHEMGTAASAPVMETQAILARTYALRNLRRFALDGYQICADTQCQVYFGLAETNPKADAAIAATAGQVLTYQNELVDALYSSTTGGTTADFSEVWNGPSRPYLPAQVDAATRVWDATRRPLSEETHLRAFIAQKSGFNDSQSPWFRWRQVATLPTLTQELKQLLTTKQHPLAHFKTITGLAVTQRSPSGRVMQLVVQTDAGPVELAKEMVLTAFSAPNSLLFYLDPILTEGKLTGYAFVGGGLGHAVGLSQSGAAQLGEQGWGRDRILGFYFPGTQLQPVHPNLTLWQPPPQPRAQESGDRLPVSQTRPAVPKT